MLQRDLTTNDFSILTYSKDGIVYYKYIKPIQLWTLV